MDGIRLRAFAETDVADLLAAWRDPQMQAWSPRPADEAGALE